MTRKTARVPDGYNGHTVEIYLEPIEVDGTVAKVRVVGSEYLIRYIDTNELKKLREARQDD